MRSIEDVFEEALDNVESGKSISEELATELTKHSISIDDVYSVAYKGEEDDEQ